MADQGAADAALSNARGPGERNDFRRAAANLASMSNVPVMRLERQVGAARSENSSCKARLAWVAIGLRGA